MNSFAWLQQHASTQGREKKKRREGKSLTKPTHLKSKHHFFLYAWLCLCIKKTDITLE